MFQRNKSQVLIVVFLMMFITLTLGAAFLYFSRSSKDITRIQSNTDKAYSLAKTGLDRAALCFQKAPLSCSIPTTPVALGYGQYWINFPPPTTQDVGGGNTLARVNITSTGQSGRATRVLTESFEALYSWTCGNSMVVTHTAGTVAPVTKTVTYGTVTTSLSGASACWITQNLGADNQASSATDATEPSAGWYWQFNHKQGYAIGPTPAWTITSINETSDWLAANDPCTLLLGTGWRLPTEIEWANADANGQVGGWDNYNEAFADVLRLHTAGYLLNSSGASGGRGSESDYWSSTQYDATTGRYLYSYSYATAMDSDNKACGFPVRCLKAPPWTCGSSMVVVHTAGTVAPVTKTVTYGTVLTPLTGSAQCWITQNLGATNQASSATDATEPSAGWYWQFNRQQGYAIGPTPAWTITSINETSDWLAANDPCTLLLGTGWRLPTNAEWINANANGAWNSYTDTYNSVLKLHAAGYLSPPNGALTVIGSSGLYWSSKQYSATNAWHLLFASNGSEMMTSSKAGGFPVRCLKAPRCGESMVVIHTAGAVAPVAKTVTYGTVSSTLGGTGAKCWITQNLGADNQASSATDATEPSAGWYWQFNRTQGYKYDTTRTPSTPPWDKTQDNTYTGWDPAKDPCTLLLGTGWRLPTSAEWTNADSGWSSYTDTYNSVLKLHAAGYLDNSGGALFNRGGSTGYGAYWSSTQNSATAGWNLSFASGNSFVGSSTKAYGYSVRCLKD